MTLVPIDIRTKKLTIDFLNCIKRIEFSSLERWLVVQVSRSVGSIGANVVEGLNSGSKKEYIRYFRIALRSANESKYWLEILKETNNDAEILSPFLKEVDEVSKIIAKIIINNEKGKA